MPTTLKLKNSVTAAATPTTLVQGEAAVNVTDKKVWVGNAASSPVQILGAGATLDGMAIGGTTAAAGKFTTLEATGVATFSAGTVSLPAITTTGDTNTGIFFPAADTIAFTEGGVESMRIDSNGNLGLGITPQTWYLNSSVYGAFQFGAGALFYGRTTSSSVNLELTTNSYLDSSAAYRYLFTGEASKYAQFSGNHAWYSAVSGTAGNSFTYSERMRITSAGDVGIGTSSPNGKVDIVSSSAGANTNTLFLTNSSGTAGTATSLVFGVGSDPTNRQAVIRGINAGGNAINLAFLTSNADAPAERMRIDSSGNVGIGTSSPAAKLDIRGSSPELYVAQDGSNNGVALAWDNSNAFAKINTIGAAWPILFLQNGTERMRITSGGEVQIGTTNITNGGFSFEAGYNGAGKSAALFGHITGTGSGNQYCIFYYDGTIIGSITQNGTTAVAYNTTSDYRLKENIAPMTNALAKVAQLKPVTYTWKADGSDGQGFIAHELQAVVPDAVTGEKDAVDKDGKPTYQGVDTSYLVATLTAAIQEQQALIENLTTRLNALEGK